MPAFPFYAYVHQNGEIICKSTFVCETGTTPREYFDSNLVMKWWKVVDEKTWEEVTLFAKQYLKNKETTQ